MSLEFKTYEKIHNEQSTWDAAIDRFRFIFKEFGNNVYLSFSGGKDSGVMVQLANQVAAETGNKFDVLYIDLEGNYKATRKFVTQIKELPQINRFYWVCLPLKLRNAVSQIQSHWICWDENYKDKGGKWIRPRPKDSININNYLDYGWDWFETGEQFETFIIKFAKWYEKEHGDKVACSVGIRCNESLRRFHTIVASGKPNYKNENWTTKIIDGHEIYNCYPMYDWETQDVYVAMARQEYYNRFYEVMYQAGRKISQVRLCQPYGDDQRQGLDQFKFFEPETWGKVLVRVNGVNFGNIYARTLALGDRKLVKPDGMSWQEYAIFLLETVGTQNIDLMRHYQIKIQRYLDYCEKHNLDIPDKQDDISLETRRIAPSWRRIAKMLMKNDFYAHTLSYSQTKADDERINFILEKYGKNL